MYTYHCKKIYAVATYSNSNMTFEILNHVNMLPSEETCMNMFRSIRWFIGVYCPKCKSHEICNRGSPFKTKYYSCKVGVCVV
jgi:hypothetical protein